MTDTPVKQTDPGDLVPRPDPSTLTRAAVDQATDIFRREMASLREVHDKDLSALRELVIMRIEAVAVTSEQRISELLDAQRRNQDSRDRAINALRDTIEVRIAAMDKATELLAATVGKVPSETDKSIGALRDLLSSRIDGMDEATKLLATNVNTIPNDIKESAASLKEVIETRLTAMDEATKLLATNVDKVPYAILQEAGNLKAYIMSKIEDVSHVSEEKFKAVDALFASNALALTAALAAQEKAVAEQNKSNTLAINTAAMNTKETIAANATQTQTAQRSLESTLADLKERVVRIESGGAGAAGQRSEQRLNMGTVIAAVAVLIALASLVLYVTKK